MEFLASKWPVGSYIVHGRSHSTRKMGSNTLLVGESLGGTRKTTPCNRLHCLVYAGRHQGLDRDSIGSGATTHVLDGLHSIRERIRGRLPIIEVGEIDRLFGSRKSGHADLVCGTEAHCYSRLPAKSDFSPEGNQRGNRS